jgi:hypothetical protein
LTQLPGICSAKSGRVHQAAFAWHLQLLNHEISPFVLYVTRQVNDKAKAEDMEINPALMELCAEKHITLGILAVDGDPQSSQTHSIQKSFNETIFSILEATNTTRKFRSVCDPLHILKPA